MFQRALAIKKTSLQDSHEDFSILLHFIGSSLFALKRYDDAVIYFSDSTERKKSHHGRADEEYAMSVVDLAAACAKTGNENRSMEVRLNIHKYERSPSLFAYDTFFLPNIKMGFT